MALRDIPYVNVVIGKVPCWYTTADYRMAIKPIRRVVGVEERNRGRRTALSASSHIVPYQLASNSLLHPAPTTPTSRLSSNERSASTAYQANVSPLCVPYLDSSSRRMDLLSCGSRKTHTKMGSLGETFAWLSPWLAIISPEGKNLEQRECDNEHAGSTTSSKLE